MGWVKDRRPIASTEIGHSSLSLLMESKILTRYGLMPKFVADRSTIEPNFARPAASYFWEALQEQSGLLALQQELDAQKSISETSASYLS